MMKNKKPAFTAGSNIMLQIAVAMNYLHESGVMHCDLKATNVLVNVLELTMDPLSSVQVEL
jgi:tRNA A-37 threonylcarbamoyl transferase component Bud32